jgi:hypothetical protein
MSDSECARQRISILRARGRARVACKRDIELAKRVACRINAACGFRALARARVLLRFLNRLSCRMKTLISPGVTLISSSPGKVKFKTPFRPFNLLFTVGVTPTPYLAYTCNLSWTLKNGQFAKYFYYQTPTADPAIEAQLVLHRDLNAGELDGGEYFNRFYRSTLTIKLVS